MALFKAVCSLLRSFSSVNVSVPCIRHVCCVVSGNLRAWTQMSVEQCM
jgi:hypothetical protein